MKWALTLLPLLLGLLVGALTPRDTAWYASLPRPAWTPPSWVFGPVWTLLYLLMGLALARLSSLRRLSVMAAVVFGVQFLLNMAWTPVFFGAKDPHTALRILWLLDLAALATTVLFYRADPMAGLLLVPYLIWLGVATALNVAIAKK